MQIRGSETAGRVLLAASIILITACSVLPFSIGPSGIVPLPTPIVLSRCDASPSVLCLISFGLQEPDQMLIELYVPPASPSDLYVKVLYRDKRSTAPCAIAVDSTTIVYCTDTLLPLGSTIGLEVYASKTSALLAKGDFVLNALELPTQVMGGTPETPPPPAPGMTLSPPATPTSGFAFPTPTSGTGFSTLTPQATSATRTPSLTLPPGTAYPNQ